MGSPAFINWSVTMKDIGKVLSHLPDGPYHDCSVSVGKSEDRWVIEHIRVPLTGEPALMVQTDIITQRGSLRTYQRLEALLGAIARLFPEEHLQIRLNFGEVQTADF